MTAAIVISAAREAAFEVRDYEGPRAWRPSGKFHCRGIGKSNYLRIRRFADSDATGFVLNCGPGTVHLTYRRADGVEHVGPGTDYILPGQFREIGCGPGVEWMLEAA